MSNFFAGFENVINNKLLNMHTAYLAKVLSVNGSTAKIQPLGYSKAYGQNAQKQSPLSNVPILNSAKYKISKTEIENKDVAKITSIAKGDIVLCVCCERDITEAKKGKNSTPALGHHNMSDSVIVGIL